MEKKSNFISLNRFKQNERSGMKRKAHAVIGPLFCYLHFFFFFKLLNFTTYVNRILYYDTRTRTQLGEKGNFLLLWCMTQLQRSSEEFWTPDKHRRAANTLPLRDSGLESSREERNSEGKETEEEKQERRGTEIEKERKGTGRGKRGGEEGRIMLPPDHSTGINTDPCLHVNQEV